MSSSDQSVGKYNSLILAILAILPILAILAKPSR